MMTLTDVADALKVSEKTVTRMLQDGSIPGFKVANQWRFYRDDFYAWIDEKRSERGSQARAGLASMLSDEIDSVPFSRLCKEELIVLNLPKGPQKAILEALSAPLVNAGIVKNPANFISGLTAREDMMSTGVGGGIAIPHLRHPGDLPVERPRIVIGTCPEGADWDAFDGKPVRLFVLPVSGEEVVHLRILSTIRRSFVVDGAVEALIAAGTPNDLIREIMKMEVLQQNAKE